MTADTQNDNAEHYAKAVKKAGKDLETAISEAYENGLEVEMDLTEVKHAGGSRPGVVVKPLQKVYL